jgi:hypothetical protein
MKLPQTGGCQCGALRYEISEAPQLVYTCHCRDCQRLTGIAFSIALVTDSKAFSLTEAAPRSIQRTADSGRTITRWDMDLERSSTRPGSRDALRVRPGSLDDTSWLGPAVHFWTRSAQPCVALPEGDRRRETQPEDLAWMRAGSS